MKRIIFAVAALLIAVGASAQHPKEGRSVIGRIENVPAQGSYTPSFSADGTNKAVRNVILMIGDGTGLAQLSSGFYTNNKQLTIFNLRKTGFVTTWSASNVTTDSAASGTAYATGHKTTNYMLGMAVDSTDLVNIPEMCEKKGLVSGVVSTDDLNGATPASFFAHQINRNLTPEIWAELPGSAIDFAAAGSIEVYREQPEATQKAIAEDYTVVTDLNDPKASSAKKLVYLPHKEETQSMAQGRGDFLPKATTYAINYLMNHRTSARKGFFLMVEGARIDKSCHSNDYPSEVKEVLDFDKAVEAAIRFAEKDGHTLVLISADHETGGLSLGYWDKPEEGTTYGYFASGDHTPIPVPIFAYGPHSQDFTGVHGNDEVSRMIQKLLRLN